MERRIRKNIDLEYFTTNLIIYKKLDNILKI